MKQYENTVRIGMYTSFIFMCLTSKVERKREL